MPTLKTDTFIKEHVITIPLEYREFPSVKDALRYIHNLMPDINAKIANHQADSWCEPEEYIEYDLISDLFNLDQRFGFGSERHTYTDVPIMLVDTTGEEPVRVFNERDHVFNFLDIVLDNWDKKDQAIFEEYAIHDNKLPTAPIEKYSWYRFMPEAVAKNEAHYRFNMVWYDDIRGKEFEDFYKPIKHNWYREEVYFCASKSTWKMDR